jgi:hypothetical protein
MTLKEHHNDKNGIWTNLDRTAPQLDYLEYYKQGKLRKPTEEQLMAEVQLLTLGDYFPLDISVDTHQLSQELEAFNNQWVPYLPREGRVNNREGMALFGLEGDSHQSTISIPEARARTGKELLDIDFSYPTELYHHCKSLHPFMEYFKPLGRTMFVKSNEGGWFAPHRDGRWLFRDCFRLIVFCQNCDDSYYDWFLGDRKIKIEQGRVYYINTRMVHKTISYNDNSLHLIVNIPVTLENVLKVLSYS